MISPGAVHIFVQWSMTCLGAVRISVENSAAVSLCYTINCGMFTCIEYFCTTNHGLSRYSLFLLYNKLWPIYVRCLLSVHGLGTQCFNRSQVGNWSDELGSHWLSVSRHLSYLTSDCDCTSACYVRPELTQFHCLNYPISCAGQVSMHSHAHRK